MAARTPCQFVEDAVADYASARSSGPDEVQIALQEVTRERTGPAAGMQIGDYQAVSMEIIARVMGARRAVEVGAFISAGAGRCQAGADLVWLSGALTRRPVR